MGLISKLLSFLGASVPTVGNEEYIDLMQDGYKETIDREIFPPDTVWAGSKSKVYHSTDGNGCSGYLPEDVDAMPEAEAIRRGLHRCKLCEWPKGSMPPEPAPNPLPLAKPVARRK